MNLVKVVAFAAAVALVGGGAGRADDKTDYAKLIVGKWEATKADPSTVPAGAVVEFQKDGKLRISHKKDDVEMGFDGTYKLNGAKLGIALTVDGAERTKEMTITKIAADAMAVKDSDGGTVEFKKK